jgi:peptidoglycan/xylan/chitin deacetylase (PgdA/CDA1 family)
MMDELNAKNWVLTFFVAFFVLVASIRFLVEEGRNGIPKMMTVGLHCRIVGRPGRAAGLAEFMDFAKSYKNDVWICTREEIAKHWYDHHFPMGLGKSISEDIACREAETEVEDDTI